MKVLVVCAHPDDEVLGCGATIARLADEGHRVFISVLSEGITSRTGLLKRAIKNAKNRLLKAGRSSATILGACEWSAHNFPDNGFDTVPLLDIVRFVEQMVKLHSPEVIYTHHPSDLNIDHQITHRAVLTATRPMPGSPVKEILAFEVLSSTVWDFGQLGPQFLPNVFVDVERSIDRKLAALEKYRDEMQPFPHARSLQSIKALAEYRGGLCGKHYAEAFEYIRGVR